MAQPIDYASPRAEKRRPRERSAAAAIGALFSLPVTIVAMFLAIASGGAGHGDYVIARALFPIPILATLLDHGTIDLPILALALLQFPLYGVIIGWSLATSRRAAIIGTASLLSLHAAAAALCFCGFLPNFS